MIWKFVLVGCRLTQICLGTPWLVPGLLRLSCPGAGLSAPESGALACVAQGTLCLWCCEGARALAGGTHLLSRRDSALGQVTCSRARMDVSPPGSCSLRLHGKLSLFLMMLFTLWHEMGTINSLLLAE